MTIHVWVVSEDPRETALVCPKTVIFVTTSRALALQEIRKYIVKNNPEFADDFKKCANMSNTKFLDQWWNAWTCSPVLERRKVYQ